MGDRREPDTRALLRALIARFLPNGVVLLVDSEESRRFLAGYLPALESMTALGGKATAYVCENYTCKLPTTEVDRFGQLLQ